MESSTSKGFLSRTKKSLWRAWGSTASSVLRIMTVGPHFKVANNFLWPFTVASTRRGTHNVEGGNAGKREDYINELIRITN
uniref:Uncharacterized protein n=1 Tax=Leersia perrieri TaxID=77586 RepID=A0A0D9X5M8_9ORYZ